MITYHCVLNNEMCVDLDSISAAQAMRLVLERNPGHTIIQCWSGDRGRRDAYGYIDYEIPPHKPVQAAPRQRPRPDSDRACTLFDDAEVVAESKLALSRRLTPTPTTTA